MLYVKITDHENSSPIEVPTEDDGSILLSTIAGQYPGATSLSFCINGNIRAVKIMDGKLYAPEGGWGDLIYRCVFPKGKSIPTEKNEEEDVDGSTKVNIVAAIEEMKNAINGMETSVKELIQRTDKVFF